MRRESALSRVNQWLWRTTNRHEVMKDLADTKWDWLRTPGGLGVVIATAFVVLFAFPVLVWNVDDGFGVVPLLFVASVFGVWFLLRRAVRLVADAPDEALDERLIAIRNRIYLTAYRALAVVLGFFGLLFLVWAVRMDVNGEITANLTITWPQANAVLWFLFGQVLVWPSLALAIAIRRRKVAL